jgi:hypothetical protein
MGAAQLMTISNQQQEFKVANEYSSKLKLVLGGSWMRAIVNQQHPPLA